MSHFDALKDIEISTESIWAIVIIFPHSDFQFGIYWKLTIYKEIDDFLCLHHFFDCSINDLASFFFSSIHQWNGQWILPQTRRNVCIFTFKPHTPNEMRKKKTEQKKNKQRTTKQKRWTEKEEYKNSNICCTAANDDVPSDQHIENYSLAHDIRMAFLNMVLVLFTYCIPHPCSHIHVSRMKPNENRFSANTLR